MTVVTILKISKAQTIKSLQDKFNKAFPFLKIELFKETQKRGHGIEKEKMYIKGNIKVNSIRTLHKFGDISIDGKRKVREIETDFENLYGLHVQVFRKSGNAWLETTATDEWTLNDQNEEGKRSNEKVKIEKENFNDHDVW